MFYYHKFFRYYFFAMLFFKELQESLYDGDLSAVIVSNLVISQDVCCVVVLLVFCSDFDLPKSGQQSRRRTQA